MSLWKRLQKWGHQWSSPAGFDRLSARLSPWLSGPGWALLLIGVVWGLAFAPMDYQQKNAFRIIYLHVPAAALSMSIYVMMAIASVIFFIWRIRLAAWFARAAAPYGAVLTAMALVTGAIWGKPTWGTYWSWGDARLTSELILFFLYLSYILLQNSFEDREHSERMAAILAIIGVINIPIIHYSVVWWNSLHQGATVFKLGAPSITTNMLWPLLICLAAFYLLFFAFVLKQMQNLILQNRIERFLER